MNRLSLYVFFEKTGTLRDFDKYYLEGLKKVSNPVVIVNGMLGTESREFLEQGGYKFLCRENAGFDFGGWKEYFETNLSGIVGNYDEIILCNCSCYGPVFPLEGIFARMDKVRCDFWGLCRHPGIPGKYPSHLQSYFMVLRSSLFSDSTFSNYFRNLKPAENWEEAVEQETQFTKYFEEKGFVSSSFVDDSLSGIYPDPTIILPEKLLGSGFPFVKRKVFSLDYKVPLSFADGTYIRTLLNYLKNKTSYPAELIKKDVVSSLPNSKLRNIFHLTYVLNSHVEDSIRSEIGALSDGSSAAVLFSSTNDLIDHNLEYLASLPKNCHLYIVVLSDEMKKLWDTKLKSSGFTYDIRIQDKRLGNAAAYWLTCRDVIEGFDYICLMQDTEIRTFSPPVIGQYLNDHCWKSILFSPEYVQNIIRLFASNSDLGLLMPTVPMFAHFPDLIMNKEWGINRDIALGIFKNLRLNVPFDEHPTAPWGSMFWIRGGAMAALYRYNWTSEDFSAEGIGGRAMRALERMYPTIAQESGYLSGWIVPEDLIEIYYDNLYCKASEYKERFDEYQSRPAWMRYAIKDLVDGNDRKFQPKKELFFAAGYLEMYPDVAESGADPWRHYVLTGKNEGRDNGQHPDEKLFFPEGYLEMYPDVAETGMDPWRHYVLIGKKAGRDNGMHPKADVFIARNYLALYPDVAESGMDPWRHYVLIGKKAGRDNGLLLSI